MIEHIDENTSDGFHTFKELYEHRIVLFASLCLSWRALAWKSKLHSDGSSFEGWFVAGMNLPTGQITYHIPEIEWDDMFKEIKELERAPKWDGHTPNDVLTRLRLMAKTSDTP